MILKKLNPKRRFKIERLFLTAAVFSLILLSSCSADKGALASSKMFNINMPENAELTVSDVRVKGFTLSWPNLGGDYEYAIAAGYAGKTDDYATALESNAIVLDFTAEDVLNGSYKVTKLIPGKEYEIKLFARKKNTRAAEYLSAKVTLPYIDAAEINAVYINGEEISYDSGEDSFTKIYIPGEEQAREYTVTYKLARLCVLYIGGEKIESGEFKIKDGETVSVTAVNEKTNAARDYEISVNPLDNGIPIVFINTENNRPITSKNNYLKADMKINGGAEGMYSGEIEIKGRGNSSFDMPKKSYNVEIADKTQILDMSPSRDWMLLANYSDKSLMRNYIAYELYRDMGAAFSPKLRFVDLILNGNYMGTYCIGERVKIDAGRLDLPKIKAEEGARTTGDDLSGSYVIEVNSTDKYSKDEIIFETKRIKWSNEHFFSIKQPGEKNMSEEAYEYISNYVNQVEDAIFAENFDDPLEGYRKYIETSTFIDWYIVNELFKQVDAGFHTSVYFYKPRGEKLCMGPVWDFDLGAGNADYLDNGDTAGWYVRKSEWFTRLFEDASFVSEFKDRWNFVKENYLDETLARIDETAALLEKSQSMNFEKWQILGTYVWPNAGNVSERTTYASEIEYLKNWLSARIEWMDKEINKVF